MNAKKKAPAPYVKLSINDNEFHGDYRPNPQGHEMVPARLSELHQATIPEVRFTMNGCQIMSDGKGRWPISVRQRPDGSVDVTIEGATILFRTDRGN